VAQSHGRRVFVAQAWNGNSPMVRGMISTTRSRSQSRLLASLRLTRSRASLLHPAKTSYIDAIQLGPARKWA
jgi:hypothetical protein